MEILFMNNYSSLIHRDGKFAFNMHERTAEKFVEFLNE